MTLMRMGVRMRVIVKVWHVVGLMVSCEVLIMAKAITRSYW